MVITPLLFEPGEQVLSSNSCLTRTSYPVVKLLAVSRANHDRQL